jgi:glyceraldehyde-3-phosphate dehydrogenase (ferredoxin)
MYWAPGNFMPILIPGKYYTFYHPEFDEPEDFANKCFGRAIKEMYSENTGVCRFHRGWAEKILPRLFEEGYGTEVDYDRHNKRILAKINEYNTKAGLKPDFWKSERVIDIIVAVSREFADSIESARKWWDKFNQDKMGAAKEYWTRFLIKYEELLGT